MDFFIDFNCYEVEEVKIVLENIYIFLNNSENYTNRCNLLMFILAILVIFGLILKE